MIRVIGVIYLLDHHPISDRTVEQTCEILERALGYDDHKIHVKESFSDEWRICKVLEEEGIMKETKPLEFVLLKRGMKKIIKINNKGFKLFSFYIRQTQIEAEK